MTLVLISSVLGHGVPFTFQNSYFPEKHYCILLLLRIKILFFKLNNVLKTVGGASMKSESLNVEF